MTTSTSTCPAHVLLRRIEATGRLVRTLAPSAEAASEISTRTS